MTDYKQLCAELLATLESWSPNGGAPLEEGAEAIAEARLIERARAALSQPEMRIIRTDRDEAGPYMLLAEPEPERLTVQQINDLPEHGENFIYSNSKWPDKITLDGDFTRTQLQQLANSVPTSRSN